MKKIISAVALLFVVLSCAPATAEYDVVIIGGTTSGTAAGIKSSRVGAKTLIVEPNSWLGGMLTAAGVSATDGNYLLRGAIWGEFRDSLEAHYGGAEALKTGWVSNVLFEPSVGNRIFQNIARREENLDVWFYSAPTSFVQNSDNSWSLTVTKNGVERAVSCKVLIDATELGDVAKSVGVNYEYGMDSRHKSGESIAPDECNDIVQDLTYALVLKDYKEDVTIEKPEGYDPSLFACCCINDLCVTPKEAKRLWSKEMMITYGKLPNDKYMINWPIEGNDYYVNMVEMSSEERQVAEAEAKHHSLCFLYFIQTEAGLNTLGIADDEFPTEDGLPLTPYHRESRRIDGKVRFTLNHISDPYAAEPLYRTAVAVGDYPVDQHHTRYSGWADLPDLYFYPIPSYGVPLGVMIPMDKKGLIIAEKSISVTNIVNGSSRLQPVVLQIGEAAGILAALAATNDCDVSQVAVREVQREVLKGGGYLLPLLDLPQTDRHFAAMQRIATTGIMRCRGANLGWENQTWFDAQLTISCRDLSQGLSSLYPAMQSGRSTKAVTFESLTAMIAQCSSSDQSDIEAQVIKAWGEAGFADVDPTGSLSRIECAVVIDAVLDPFNSYEVDIQGNFLN